MFFIRRLELKTMEYKKLVIKIKTKINIRNDVSGIAHYFFILFVTNDCIKVGTW